MFSSCLCARVSAGLFQLLGNRWQIASLQLAEGWSRKRFRAVWLLCPKHRLPLQAVPNLGKALQGSITLKHTPWCHLVSETPKLRLASSHTWQRWSNHRYRGKLQQVRCIDTRYPHWLRFPWFTFWLEWLSSLFSPPCHTLAFGAAKLPLFALPQPYHV